MSTARPRFSLPNFWSQPGRGYRNFQLVFTLLTLNFALPALSYIFAPQIVQTQFSRIGELLAGTPYTFPEAESRLWRYLGSANVMTLALMCFLLQLDLRRFFPVLVPLVFMKGFNASLFLGDFLLTGHPSFLAVALLDFGTAALFLLFARPAYAEIQNRPDHELLPPSILERAMNHWFGFERRWRDQILDAMIPRLEPGSPLPGFSELALNGFWEELRTAAPPLLRLGARASVWMLIFGAPFFCDSWRPFWLLSAGDRDTVLSRAGSSRFYLVRQMVLTLKLLACFAYFREPNVRTVFALKTVA